MREPLSHSCPDGSAYRVSLIQSLQQDPTFDGATFTFHVEREATDEEEAGDAAGTGTTASAPPEGSDVPEYFQVRVRMAPIFVSLLDLGDRRTLADRATRLVVEYLDRDHREDAVLKVSSDGAVRLDGELFARQLPVTEVA